MIERCFHIHGIKGSEFPFRQQIMRFWICPVTRCSNFGLKMEIIDNPNADDTGQE